MLVFGCMEWCIDWDLGVVWWWDDGLGDVGAVVEREGEGLDGVLGGMA